MGATRFVGQKAGNEEMATDQFGSGGGFSSMVPALTVVSSTHPLSLTVFVQFQQTPDAKWQSDDVANYLKVPDSLADSACDSQCMLLSR